MQTEGQWCTSGQFPQLQAGNGRETKVGMAESVTDNNSRSPRPETINIWWREEVNFLLDLWSIAEQLSRTVNYTTHNQQICDVYDALVTSIIIRDVHASALALAVLGVAPRCEGYISRRPSVCKLRRDRTEWCKRLVPWHSEKGEYIFIDLQGGQ